MSVVIEAHGKRFALKPSPMTPLRALVADVLGQLGLAGTVDPDACQLLTGKKALALDTPLRFAALPTGAKLALVTGREPRLGVAEPAAAAAAPVPPRPPQRPPQPPLPQQPQRVEATRAQAPTSAPAPAVAPPAPAAAAAAAAAAPPAPAAPAPRPAPPPPSPAAATAAATGGGGDPSAAIFGRPVAVFTREAEAAADAAAGAPAPDDVDDSFYDFNEADFAAVSAGYARRRAAEGRATLQTRAMREAAAAARAAAAPPARVRVHLPGGRVLQAEFAAAAPLAELRALVARALPAGAAFHLFVAPPKTVLRDVGASFYAAGLCPAARVHVGLEPGQAEPALRPEVEALLGPPPARARGGGGGGGGGGEPEARQERQVRQRLPEGEGGAAAAAPAGKREVPGAPKWFKR